MTHTRAIRTHAPSVRRTIAIFVALAAAALFAAGCGSSDGRLSKSDYVKQSNKIQKDLEKSTNDAASALTSGNTAKIHAAAKQIAGQIDKSIAEVKKLKPPKEWQKYHDQLLAGMQEARDGFLKLSTMKEGSSGGQLMQQITHGADQAQKAIDAINAHR